LNEEFLRSIRKVNKDVVTQEPEEGS